MMTQNTKSKILTINPTASFGGEIKEFLSSDNLRI